MSSRKPDITPSSNGAQRVPALKLLQDFLAANKIHVKLGEPKVFHSQSEMLIKAPDIVVAYEDELPN